MFCRRNLQNTAYSDATHWDAATFLSQDNVTTGGDNSSRNTQVMQNVVRRQVSLTYDSLYTERPPFDSLRQKACLNDDH